MAPVRFSEGTREADRAARSERQSMKLKKPHVGNWAGICGQASHCLQKENHSVMLLPKPNQIKLLDMKCPS